MEESQREAADAGPTQLAATDTGASLVRAAPGLARIAAWDMKQLGLLHIRTIGQDRFRLLRTESQSDGLVLGEVELLDPDEDQRVPAEHRPCVDLLSRILDDMRDQQEARRESDDDAEASEVLSQPPFAEPYHLDSCAWVSNRLCEVLPVPLKAKQKLMELEDPQMRLRLVDEYLRGKGVVSG